MAVVKTEKVPGKSLKIIRYLYLYVVSIIGLITFIIGAVGFMDNVLKNYVFQVDETQEYSYTYPAYECTKTAILSNDAKRTDVSQEEMDKCQQNVEKRTAAMQKNNVYRQFSISIAQLLIGLFVWLFHWSIIQKEKKLTEK